MKFTLEGREKKDLKIILQPYKTDIIKKIPEDLPTLFIKEKSILIF